MNKQQKFSSLEGAISVYNTYSNSNKKPDEIGRPDTDKYLKVLNIGRKIRELRRSKDLTLKELSAITGLSIPLLSQIENEIVIPPIPTLLKISYALKKDIAFFFQTYNRDEKISVVTSSERIHLDDTSVGYFYESLAHKRRKKNMDSFLVNVEKRDISKLPFFSHEGEEFVFVLEGAIEFKTPEKSYRLKSGDSIYFDSDIPHSSTALGKKNAKLLLVFFGPPEKS